MLLKEDDAKYGGLVRSVRDKFKIIFTYNDHFSCVEGIIKPIEYCLTFSMTQVTVIAKYCQTTFVNAIETPILIAGHVSKDCVYTHR